MVAGNSIITDGWSAYNWMNNRDSDYHHIVHIHMQNDFGFGRESTSHVEFIWSVLKRMIEKFYVSVSSKNLSIMPKNANGEKNFSFKQ